VLVVLHPLLKMMRNLRILNRKFLPSRMLPPKTWTLMRISLVNGFVLGVGCIASRASILTLILAALRVADFRLLKRNRLSGPVQFALITEVRDWVSQTRTAVVLSVREGANFSEEGGYCWELAMP
jgi:hypothetical protein